ncbi:caspase family protein [Sinorhizobium sp. BG8]|uniref:caspase family protein n=1 Tax=Sinorhizobium sp. BG8 TaxID=2613773 RepID=UPI0032B1A177
MKTGSAFILLSVLCLSAMLAFLPNRADAQENGNKLALVVGNSDYASVGALPNAKRDAQAFHAFLLAQKFQSTLLVDTDRKTLAEALGQFVRRIGPEDTALFYFAGHGMQLRGENFLLGTEAALASEFDVPGETLALSEVISAMERRAKVSLLFIDACRDNPLANRLNAEVEGASRGAATRDLRRSGPAVRARWSPLPQHPVRSRSTVSAIIRPSPRPSLAIWRRPASKSAPRSSG